MNEKREHFIRQPLEDIRQRQEEHQQETGEPLNDPSLSPPSSILVKPDPETYWAERWLTRAGEKRRQVRFADIPQESKDEEEMRNEEEPSGRIALPVLSPPTTSLPSKMMESHARTAGKDQDDRLPPLPVAGDKTTDESSWVERQVAKVRQRRLWTHQQQLSSSPPRDTLVRLPTPVTDENLLAATMETPRKPSITWEITLDKNDRDSGARDQQEELPDVKPYDGWPHFPARLSSRIRNRGQQVLTSKQNDKGGEEEHQSIKNSFQRRKKFGRTLLARLLGRTGSSKSLQQNQRRIDSERPATAAAAAQERNPRAIKSHDDVERDEIRRSSCPSRKLSSVDDPAVAAESFSSCPENREPVGESKDSSVRLESESSKAPAEAFDLKVEISISVVSSEPGSARGITQCTPDGPCYSTSPVAVGEEGGIDPEPSLVLLDKIIKSSVKEEQTESQQQSPAPVLTMSSESPTAQQLDSDDGPVDQEPARQDSDGSASTSDEDNNKRIKQVRNLITSEDKVASYFIRVRLPFVLSFFLLLTSLCIPDDNNRINSLEEQS